MVMGAIGRVRSSVWWCVDMSCGIYVFTCMCGVCASIWDRGSKKAHIFQDF